MNGLGSVFATNILKLITGKQSTYTAGTSKYIALSSANPMPDGSGLSEPASSTGYTRVLIGDSNQALTQLFGNPTFDSVTNKTTITNIAQIKFNRLSSSAGTVTHFAIMDAATGGNVLFYGTLKDGNGDDITLTLASGESAVIEVGGAVIELAPTTSA